MNLLRTAIIEIHYVAPEENPSVLEMFRENFANIERVPEKALLKNPSSLKNEVVTESEEFDVRQCKMVLSFKTDCDNIYAVKMLNTIEAFHECT